MRIAVRGFAIVVAAAAAACGGVAAEEPLVRMRATRDRICACKDTACVDQARNDFEAWRAANRDRLDNTRASSSFTKSYTEAYVEASACESKVALDAARAAQRDAEDAAVRAEKAQAAAQEAQRLAAAEIDGFRTKFAELAKQTDDVNRDLLAAKTQADRDAIAVRQSAIIAQHEQLKAALEARRAKLKPK